MIDSRMIIKRVFVRRLRRFTQIKEKKEKSFLAQRRKEHEEERTRRFCH